MATIVLPFSEVDVEKIKLSPPRRSDIGRVVVGLSYEGKRLCIKAPTMSSPFGISEYGEPPNRRYTLDVSFRGLDISPDLQAFQAFLYQIDNKVRTHIKDNSMEIFNRKKPISDDTLDETFIPSIKLGKEPGMYAPVIRFKVMTNREGEPTTDAFLNKSTPMNVIEIEKGSMCTAVIEPQIWFLGKTQCGVTWRMHQVRVREPLKKLDYQFSDDEEDDLDQGSVGGSIVDNGQPDLSHDDF